MYPLSRREAMQLLAASSLLIQDKPSKRVPKYVVRDGKIQFHCTAGYPARWQQVYQNTIDHFAGKWGRVGPTNIFLIENTDWDQEKRTEVETRQLEQSQQELKRVYCELQGHGLRSEHLDWQTGNHWTSWNNRPARIMITMTMSPFQDPMQFVIGPIHEYNHALQTVHGYGQEAIDGNQMGHALWTGPAWWREGSSVLVAALYSYQHPDLFDQLGKPYTWGRFSSEMNRNLELFQQAQTPLRDGSTHDDWQRLEKQNLVHPVVYAGGSVACAMLLKRAGSLENFMNFYPLVPQLGWQKAFEQHFQIGLDAFYKEFAAEAAAARVQRRSEPAKDNWFGFLKTIP